jgi:hypothetical protein
MASSFSIKVFSASLYAAYSFALRVKAFFTSSGMGLRAYLLEFYASVRS